MVAYNKNQPEKYPINPKTKLAQGDIWRMGIFFIIFGLLMFAGSFIISWYEGSMGPCILSGNIWRRTAE